MTMIYPQWCLLGCSQSQKTPEMNELEPDKKILKIWAHNFFSKKSWSGAIIAWNMQNFRCKCETERFWNKHAGSKKTKMGDSKLQPIISPTKKTRRKTIMGTQRKVLQKPITKWHISVLSFQKIIPIELDLREPTHMSEDYLFPWVRVLAIKRL